MPPITQYGSFTQAIANQINQNINAAGIGFLNGNVIMLDPYLGVDTNDGITAPVQTLGAAYGIGRDGKNDVIALIGNGVTTATARLGSAFTWAKNALHLIGVSSGVNISNRSRIAPTSGATAFANFFTVSGSGCLFQNIQFFQGFDSGVAAAICMTVTGSRNLFYDCHIAGMGDTTSAQSSTSRNLVISVGGENMFVNSVIGLDTVQRTTTNSSIEFKGGTARNQFISSKFIIDTTGSSLIVKALTGGIDRYQLFDECTFINAINSGGSSQTALGSIGANGGGPNGIIIYRHSTLVGIAAWEATTKTSVYVDGAAPNSGTGVSVNPA